MAAKTAADQMILVESQKELVHHDKAHCKYHTHLQFTPSPITKFPTMGPNYDEFSTARLFNHDYLPQGLFMINKTLIVECKLTKKGRQRDKDHTDLCELDYRFQSAFRLRIADFGSLVYIGDRSCDSMRLET